jgi:hypothetical protein
VGLLEEARASWVVAGKIEGERIVAKQIKTARSVNFPLIPLAALFAAPLLPLGEGEQEGWE